MGVHRFASDDNDDEALVMAWEDSSDVSIIWLGAAIGTLAISMIYTPLGVLSGVMGIAGFFCHCSARHPGDAGMWPALVGVHILGWLSIVLSSTLSLLAIVLSLTIRNECTGTATACYSLFHALLFNAFWFGLYGSLSGAVVRLTGRVLALLKDRHAQFMDIDSVV